MKIIICILAVIGTVTAGLLGGDHGHQNIGQYVPPQDISSNSIGGNIQTIRIIQETAPASHHNNRFSQTQAFSQHQQASQEYIPPSLDSSSHNEVKTLRIIQETVPAQSFNQGFGHSVGQQDIQTLRIIQENGVSHQHEPLNNGFAQSNSHGQGFNQLSQQLYTAPLPVSQSFPEQNHNHGIGQTQHVQQPNLEYLPSQNNAASHGNIQTLRVIQESGASQSNLHVQQPDSDYLPPQNDIGVGSKSHGIGIGQSHQGHIENGQQPNLDYLAPQNNGGSHSHEQVQTLRIIQESGPIQSNLHVQQPNSDYLPPQNHAGVGSHSHGIGIGQSRQGHLNHVQQASLDYIPPQNNDASHSHSHVQQPNQDYVPPLNLAGSNGNGNLQHSNAHAQHIQQPNLDYLPPQNFVGSNSNGIVQSHQNHVQHIQQPNLAYLPPQEAPGPIQSHHGHIQQPNLDYLAPQNVGRDVKTLRIINEHVENHAPVSHGEVKTLRIIKEPAQSHNHQPHIKTIRIIQAGGEQEHHESHVPVQQEIKTIRIIQEGPSSHAHAHTHGEVKTLRIIQEGGHHSGSHEGHSKLIRVINEH